jgi:hypothetical protein
MGSEEGTDFIFWDPHTDPQRFGFIGTSDDAAIIIGEDNDGFAIESWLKDPFTRDVEIVAVHQGK